MPKADSWDCGSKSHPGHEHLSLAMLSVVYGGLCVELITHSEESYRVCVCVCVCVCVSVCDLKTSTMSFDVLLTVHLSIILVTDQLNAQILVL